MRISAPENASSSDDDHDAVPASTNPLSLTPDEIAQYRVAGLRLDQELPRVKNWPHRGLGVQTTGVGRGKSKTQDDENEDVYGDQKRQDDIEEVGERKSRGPWLRNQHLGVLTTILHRCFLEGDVKRAGRAWAMLLRMQVAGRGVDVRGSGYWEIGASLLMRSHDKPKKKFSYERDGDSEEESGEEEVDADGDGDGEREGEGEKRWGTKEGLQKVKDYYERLILEFPFNRQFPGNVSALDFWPAMVGCEIYGIQVERAQALRAVQHREQLDDEDEGDVSQESESEDRDEEDGKDQFASDQRRRDRRRRRMRERRWLEREQIRQTALSASQDITKRLDELMGTPPYSDSHNLLRLRGMLALYIGDLSVPAMPLVEGDDAGNGEGEGRSTERRFVERQRIIEHQRSKVRREKERERARKLFERILREGGEDDGIGELCASLELEDEEQGGGEVADVDR